MRSDSPQKHDGFKWSTLAPLSNPLRKAAAEKKPPGKAAGGPKLNLKFPKVWGPKAPQVRRNSTSTTDKRTEPQDIPDLTAQPPPAPPPPALTFEQHLSALHLSEAGRLLLAREERLFVGGPDDKAPPLEVPSGDVDALAADRQTLEEAVLQTLRGSLDQMDADALKSAVTFMQQEDECDDGWEQYGGMAPPWRLRGWRQLHDETLRSLVEERMDAPPTPSTEQSSIQADVHGMGRRLRRDLLLVAERVKPCYPSHLAICQLYATWYHHCISIRLRRLADFGLDDRDCTFLLRWVNDYYPQLLQEPQLAADIDAKVLQELLPENLLSPLEEQYLSHQQRELTTYVGRILDQAQEAWTKGEEPPKEDGCFVSPTAYDVIQMVNGIVNAAAKVVGDPHKAQNLTRQLQDLLHRFRTFQAQVIKRNKANSAAFVKANLGCVAQFRHFLSTQSRLFPEDVREGCLSVLSDMKQSAHDYLLNPVHRNLKLCYRKLFSQEWLKKSTLVLLLSGLEDEMPQLQGSSESCHRELIGQLHQEVSVEYARRLLKGELRLKDKQQQQQAADNVDDDACALHDFFARHGSEEAWLQKALSMMAEILKLQDLPAIQCQVASLGSDFPDFSEKHVMSLLKLKCSLTKEDRMNIQAVLAEIPKDCGRSRPFFSFVLVK
ncbi:tumor necrosis factor alpha-induced protein 2 isoform X1 [Hippocampus comes]|uniref:tumor necrosis factor alpha-induced protein 2 isoform X1 n=1 Tax=Hippocampus comes TaxID=109280 RepID=UPI00094E421D|nr:PREDICTED: tumor necrosis factor alpha-induced protein 2-like isoform X1 [Hippocampus comes]